MMEPHAATALWDGGRLEVVDSNQGTTWIQGELVKMFSLDESSVRVRSEHVGGGFGSKGLRAHQVSGGDGRDRAAPSGARGHDPSTDVLASAGYRSPTTSTSGSAPAPSAGCAHWNTAR